MDGIEIYTQGKLTFIITQERITVRTSLMQVFYLEPKAHYWQRRTKMIATLIRLNEIKNLNELSTWCGQGVDWIPIYSVARTEALVLK